MKTWFRNVERIEALELAASEWVGTPFVANSRAKGKRGGVCCHMLAEQLYIEAGYDLPFRVPAGSMKWSDVSKQSLIEKFFDDQTELFQTLENVTIDDVLPGDVIGFKIGGCVHHVGVALIGDRFVHCMRGIGTRIHHLNDPTYSGRIEKIWRPKP